MAHKKRARLFAIFARLVHVVVHSAAEQRRSCKLKLVTNQSRGRRGLPVASDDAAAHQARRFRQAFLFSRTCGADVEKRAAANACVAHKLWSAHAAHAALDCTLLAPTAAVAAAVTAAVAAAFTALVIGR